MREAGDRSRIAAPLAACLLSFAILASAGPLFGPGPIGAIARQAVGIALPALFVPLLLRQRLRDALGLTRPTAGQLLAGFLVGASWWGLAVTILVPFAVFTVGADPEALQEANRHIALHGDWPGTLLGLVLAPAIGEELLFRGAVCRTLARERSPALGIAVSALLFCAFHPPAARMVVAFGTGALLAFLVVATGNLWVSMLAHGVHNATVLILLPAADPTGDALAGKEAVLAAISALCLGLGFWVLRHTTRSEPSRTDKTHTLR